MEGFKPRNSRGGFSGNRGGSRGGFGGSRGSFGGRSRGSRGGFGGERSGSGFGRSDRRPVELHDAVCNECKQKCQVPFKPTGDKPVYCRECFGKNESPRNGGSAGNAASSEQLKKINEKLDKILKILDDLEIVGGDDDEGIEEDSDTKEEITT